MKNIVLVICAVQVFFAGVIGYNFNNARAARSEINAQVSENHVQVTRNTAAFCALRKNFKVRIRETNAFLKKNPNGIPGISAGTLRRSNGNLITTVAALHDIKCPPGS